MLLRWMSFKRYRRKLMLTRPEVAAGFVCLFYHHFSPMGPINELQRCPSRVWSHGIYPSLPGSRLRIFIAMQVQHFYTSSTNSLVDLTSSRFPLRKPEEKITPAESRNHKFRLGGRTLYPLVHGGSPALDTTTLLFSHYADWAPVIPITGCPRGLVGGYNIRPLSRNL